MSARGLTIAATASLIAVGYAAAGTTRGRAIVAVLRGSTVVYRAKIERGELTITRRGSFVAESSFIGSPVAVQVLAGAR